MCQVCHVPPVARRVTATPLSASRLRAGELTMVVDRDGGAADPAVLAQFAEAASPGRVHWTRLHRLDRATAELLRVIGSLEPSAGHAVVVEDPYGPGVPPPLVAALTAYARRAAAFGGCAVLAPAALPGRSARHGFDAVIEIDGSPRAPRRRTLRRTISWLDPLARHAVAAAYERGYWHPGDGPSPEAGPLLVPLADGGYVPRSGWHRSVADALGHVDVDGDEAFSGVATEAVPAWTLVGASPASPDVVRVAAAIEPPSPDPATVEPATVRPAPVEPATVEPAMVASVPISVGPLPVVDGAASLTLDVRLFGRFEVRGGDGEPLDLQGQRGPAVFRYLLAQPGRRVPRDVLLEQFWPDVDPVQARNRLQVALSCLRRSLRPVVDAPVVEHRAGHYFVTSALTVTTDVDAFDRARVDARHAEEHGDVAAAIASYRRAAELYRGPYLGDTPYDEWTTLPRESYRIAHLDVLDRLACLLEHADRPAECVNVGLQMLDVDACHEEAHRLLMRSYLRLGRGHQALRQFELCRRVLRATLEVSPSSHTLGVYREVRAALVDTA